LYFIFSASFSFWLSSSPVSPCLPFLFLAKFCRQSPPPPNFPETMPVARYLKPSSLVPLPLYYGLFFFFFPFFFSVRTSQFPDLLENRPFFSGLLTTRGAPVLTFPPFQPTSSQSKPLLCSLPLVQFCVPVPSLELVGRPFVLPHPA